MLKTIFHRILSCGALQIQNGNESNKWVVDRIVICMFGSNLLYRVSGKIDWMYLKEFLVENHLRTAGICTYVLRLLTKQTEI